MNVPAIGLSDAYAYIYLLPSDLAIPTRLIYRMRGHFTPKQNSNLQKSELAADGLNCVGEFRLSWFRRFLHHYTQACGALAKIEWRCR